MVDPAGVPAYLDVHPAIRTYIHTYLDGDGDGRLNTDEGDVDFDSDGAPDCLDTVIHYPNNTTPTTGGGTCSYC